MATLSVSDFMIPHRPGNENKEADYFSRHSIDLSDDKDDCEGDAPLCNIHATKLPAEIGVLNFKEHKIKSERIKVLEESQSFDSDLNFRLSIAKTGLAYSRSRLGIDCPSEAVSFAGVSFSDRTCSYRRIHLHQ